MSAMVCAQLVGCAALSRDQTSSIARPARESIREFAIDGRISVTRANERVQASIVWQHSAGASDEIDVFSPVGGQMARLSSSPDGAQLVTAERERVVAPTAEALSARLFGSPLPLTGMSDWVLGRAAGQPVSAQRDAVGRFEYLAEAGWVIRYLEYENGDAAALPRTMDFERGDLRVRLRVDAWRIVE
ncbi:MAG: outer membrane lipoprotein LolB [Sterolibacteriaceae bacterium]|nr:outer membrane lipoprotein LolB [Sterolibacteriaceae bacterium]MBK9086280.1 outer membrane lipoprotein LolB [Sterolibacteriaceae bacterium]